MYRNWPHLYCFYLSFFFLPFTPTTPHQSTKMATPRQPSPEQLAAMQQLQQQMANEAAKRGLTTEEFAKQQRDQLNADAAKQGLTTEQYVSQLRARAIAAQQQQQRQAGSPGPQQQQGQQTQGQQGQTTTHQVPVNTGGPPDPKAIAVAKFLRSQNLKTRTCVMDGQRKDLFKGITASPFPSLHYNQYIPQLTQSPF